MATLYDLNAPSPDTWASGARSDVRLYQATCYFGMELPIDNDATVVGLNVNDEGHDYREIDFGYEFRGQSYRVMEGGVQKTGWRPHYETNRYYVMRRPDRTVLYVERPAGTPYNQTFFDVRFPGIPLPGNIIYISTKKSYDSVFLDISFFQEGDSITDAKYGEGEWLGLAYEQPTDIDISGMSFTYNEFPLVGVASEYPNLMVGLMPLQITATSNVATAEMTFPLQGLASAIPVPFAWANLPLQGEADDLLPPLQYGISATFPMQGDAYSQSLKTSADGKLPLAGVTSEFSTFLTGTFDITDSLAIGLSANRMDLSVAFDATPIDAVAYETAVITNTEPVAGTGPFPVTELVYETVELNDYYVIAIGRSDEDGNTVPGATDGPTGSYPPGTVVIWQDVSDSVVSETYASASGTVSSTVYETAALNDTIDAAVLKREDITDTALIVANAYLSELIVTVRDTFDANSYVSAVQTKTVDIVDAAVITDDAPSYLSVDVTDTAVITSSVVDVARLISDLIESAVATSYTSESGTVYAVVSEAALITTIATPRLTLTVDELEQAWFADTMVGSGGTLTQDPSLPDATDTPFEATDAWTANVVTWAMSRHDYSAVPITGMADRFASSPTGLFEKSADYADFFAKTAAADFGTATLKCIPSSYTYGKHIEPMTISVTADVEGIKTTYEYVQMARDANDYRGIRTDFGRGIRSSYYQLTFQPTGYADILYCEPIVRSHSRRI